MESQWNWEYSGDGRNNGGMRKVETLTFSKIQVKRSSGLLYHNVIDNKVLFIFQKLKKNLERN